MCRFALDPSSGRSRAQDEARDEKGKAAISGGLKNSERGRPPHIPN